ncbi:MAG: cobaltochelatase subunit CobN [Gammaproteobacteria bacterium]|nr:cobaltochelatase subunit CobN [Gammaproteobacteria bacterium]
MHLLQAKAGSVSDGSEAVDLGQSPGAIVFLSAADTELACLAAACAELDPDFPSVRLANLMHLRHPLSVDRYVDTVIGAAKLVIVRLLGGAGYWSYGTEQLVDTCQQNGILLALLPGDDQPDPELTAKSTLPESAGHRLWQFCLHGGRHNAAQLFNYAASLLGHERPWLEPAPLPRAGIYWPAPSTQAGSTQVRIRNVVDLRAVWLKDAPVVAIIVYRALVQADNLAPVLDLIQALREAGINALPLYCASLKDPACAALIERLVLQAEAKLILNGTAFASSTPGAARGATPFDAAGCPVLQVVFSGGNEGDWASSTRGLSARDIAMNVALPEVDGRILSRAVSFKAEARFDQRTQCGIVTYAARADRIHFVARLAAAWVKLADTAPAARRVALILANYPNRDGRLGNGVGLDTPAGTVNVLRALARQGYRAADIPADGNGLINRLAEGPTNAATDGRTIHETYALDAYLAAFDRLPAELKQAVSERWGSPEADPFYSASHAAFALPAFRCGNIIIGLQPARGYNIDPSTTYHDPALVPPHGYLAFYAWLREHERVQAIVHMGKHGNLEWLPGKALALSASCFPEAALGALPHIYPFIVNDPGEGTQAKRRAQAVIVDHLTPPLTRAESYGPLAELEALVDEYYEASGVDPRRLSVLRDEILALSGAIGLDLDCGIEQQDDANTALTKLDNYLCELKELQIRDGLHVFGESPQGRLRTDLLAALTRLPRGDGKGGNASLVRALARDLELGGFDPLDCCLGEPWQGPRPAALHSATLALAYTPWRTHGDTVERLELLAGKLIDGTTPAPAQWPNTLKVLHTIQHELGPAVSACGAAEIAGIVRALDGRYLEPGPAGAPTRGRPEVLPTGRNFYSVDTRTVPTPAAWHLGWKSAGLLLERFRQEHGAWPRNLALSAWGTANMRTGGDDIAQALALMGVKPTWDANSRRVTGFEIMPLSLLDRPRVDVTLRISGFFRDAFPTQIDLVDSAVRAVAALDEPERDNPLAATAKRQGTAFKADGLSQAEAARKATLRIFGSKPGAYGAGLQALLDERGWRDDGDLARAYVAWGGYAYGGGTEGRAAHGQFEARLAHLEGVVHNQDNREHDLLDSDDYYQFEGGMAAAVRHFAGHQPVIYHNDHSRPERPRIRHLEEEIAQVVRARVVNPKWIAGVMRHGYKGAFEIAATVDYLFAFAATARAVRDHHFDAVYEAYLGDPKVRQFIEDNNPAGLREIAQRLLEAQERGLWHARSNSARADLRRLTGSE